MQQRKVRDHLAVLRHAEEEAGNLAATCRYVGISRTVFNKWCNRFEELGEEGFGDRPSRPLHSPRATRVDVVARIAYLRQHYHFGPLKISMYPKRYYDIEIFRSGVWPVLDRGIRHTYIKTATLRLNGKIKRPNNIDSEELHRMLNTVAVDGSESFNDKFQQSENYYIRDCPHGSLGGQTPNEGLKQKPTRPPSCPSTSVAHLK